MKCCSNNEMKEDAANHQQVNDNNEKANIKSKIRKKFRDSNAYKYAIASSRMKGGDSSKSDSSESKSHSSELKSHSSESKSHSSESKIDSSESKSDSSESKIDSFESKIDSSSSSKTEEEHPIPKRSKMSQDSSNTDYEAKDKEHVFKSRANFNGLVENKDMFMKPGGSQQRFSVGIGNQAERVTFDNVSSAAKRIEHGIRRTPCDNSPRLSHLLNMDVHLKREYMQVTGSFKERGARNTLLLLSEEENKRGVIAASAGNHGLALAYHGNQLNIPVTVIMPVNAPIMKVKQCKLYNANVHLTGADIIEAKARAMAIADEEDLCYINGYDHPYILAGQGTCGVEIYEQVEDIDAVVIPIGGGGLIAGCAIALKHLNPNISIIGVESNRSASFMAAAAAKRPVRIDVKQSMTLADGLCVAKVGTNAFYNAYPLIDRLIQVDENFIAVALLRLIEEEKCVVEGAGATGLAAAFAGLLPELCGKRVVFPLCGGNIDSTVLGRVMDRGLAADGRLVKFTVVVSDRPGGLSDLIKYVSDMGAGIKDIFHERAWLKTSIHTVRNKVIIEVRDFLHGEEIRKGLCERYYNLTWGSDSVYDFESTN